MKINRDVRAQEEKMKELELYVHIPFCVKKCNYCDFLSAPASERTYDAYVSRLLAEIGAAGLAYKTDGVTSVFIGGGTPSVLSAAQMRQLLRRLKDSFPVLPDAEITVECNPGTLDAEKLQAYYEAGVNRLSIGLQSADEKELRMLGRIHTFEQFVQNYELARKTGFKNINVDIISAIPGQKINDYRQTLLKVTALKPEHISAYALIIEEGTPFYEQMRWNLLQLPSEEVDRQMYQMTKDLLRQSGYERYEISNYARPGFECRHNTGYWLRKNYLGIGLGAASCIENVRFANIADLSGYLKTDAADLPHVYAQREKLNERAQMEEFMFLGLRLMRGVSAEDFQKQFSLTMESVYGEVIQKQLNQKLIEQTKTGYCLTDYGIDISNYVMAEYLFH